MLRILLLNGPPRSGKDTIAGLLGAGTTNESGKTICNVKFADPLYRYLRTMYNLPMDYCEKHKDKPHTVFGGLTIRQHIIDFSEEFLKPTFGQDIYGRVVARRIKNHYKMNDTIICTDTGFIDEVNGLIAELDWMDIQFKIKMIHLMRDQKTFYNDSRDYVDHPDIDTYKIFVFENKAELAAENIKREFGPDWF